MQPIPVFDDGLLRFEIRNRDTGETTPHEIDVLALRIVCETCEQMHNLPVDENGGYVVKGDEGLAFLNDLAGRLASLGVANCTPSMALTLWFASAREVESLKKNMSEMPNLPSGSESPLGCPTEQSAVSDSATPAESSTVNGSAY